MKKIALFFSLAAIVYSCSKIEEINNPVQDEILTEVGSAVDLPEVIYASVVNEDDTQSRTYVSGKQVLWHNGDEISLFMGKVHNLQFYNENEDGTADAKFNRYTNESVEESSAEVLLPKVVYPYNENTSYAYEDGVEKLFVYYPSEQNYAPGSFGRGTNLMVGALPDNINTEHVYFRNACGYLVIKLYGNTRVKSISLTAIGGEKIAGKGQIIATHDAAPEITMTNEGVSTVILNCGNEGVALSADRQTPTEFWFALPPVNIESGLKILVTDTNDNVYSKFTQKAVNIERNSIQPMAALEFVANTLPYNTIKYTLAGGVTTPISFSENAFNAAISEHYFDEVANKFVIKFNSSVTTIKDAAFKATGIQTIEIPESVVTIEKEAFSNTPLTAITIPGSVNAIGVDVFNYCEALTAVTFLPSPDNTSLRLGYSTRGEAGKSTFYEVPLNYIYLDRELIYVDEDNEPYTANSYNTAGVFATFNGNGTVSLTIGEQVRTISKYMFCSVGIDSLAIPANVMLIDECAFSSCGSLTTLFFEENETPIEIRNKDGQANLAPFYNSPLTHIYYNRNIVYTIDDAEPFTPSGETQGIFAIDVAKAAQQKNSKSTIYIGPLITTIPEYAFCNLPIKEITIPSTVMTIGNDAFNGCNYLHTVTIEEGPIDPVSRKPVPITLGYNSVNIDEGTFCECELREVNLNRPINYPFTGGSLNDPTKGVFVCREGKRVLTDITIGDQVKELPPYIFAYAAASTVDLNKVTTIGKGVFEESQLTSITIPSNVESIDYNAFAYCYNLHTINIEESSSAITISTQKGEWAPFYESPLSTIKINRNVIYNNENGANFIPDTSNEGLFCNKRTSDVARVSVSIGANVNAISDFMFSGLNIEQIWIPREVTSIGNSAFANCYIFDGLTCNHSTPPSLGTDAFKNCGKNTSKGSIRYISVIAGAKAAFEKASGWSNFKNIITEWTPSEE